MVFACFLDLAFQVRGRSIQSRPDPSLSIHRLPEIPICPDLPFFAGICGVWISGALGDITTSAAVAIKNRVVSWTGDIPSQKWGTFYTKVLSKFATRKGLKLRVLVEVSDVSEQDVEEMRASLLDLGLDDEIEVK